MVARRTEDIYRKSGRGEGPGDRRGADSGQGGRRLGTNQYLSTPSPLYTEGRGTRLWASSMALREKTY